MDCKIHLIFKMRVFLNNTLQTVIVRIRKVIEDIIVIPVTGSHRHDVGTISSLQGATRKMLQASVNKINGI